MNIVKELQELSLRPLDQMSMNNLITEIHSYNIGKGWWPPGTNYLEKIQLTNTEASEATEGVRKGLLDDKLPHHLMEHVELADVLLRALDLMGYFGVQYRPEGVYDWKGHINPDKFCVGRTPIVDHLVLTMANCAIVTGISCHGVTSDAGKAMLQVTFNNLLACLFEICQRRGIDVWGIASEKQAVNEVRPDHMLENRAKEGGKKV